MKNFDSPIIVYMDGKNFSIDRRKLLIPYEDHLSKKISPPFSHRIKMLNSIVEDLLNENF